MRRPSPLNYDDYRLYLSDWYDWMKETNPSFSFRAFSQWAGLRSPNQLQLIIKGKRNITDSTLPEFLKILKLRRKEQKYFELLVKFNQAAKPASKARYFQELSSFLKKYGESLKHSQYEYLTKWYYPVIRELVTVKGFKENAAWIAKKIGHGVTPRKVKEAVKRLQELDLLKRNENGKLIQAESVISTGSESTESAVYLYHDQMLKMASEALHIQRPEDRNFAGMTFACRQEDIPEVTQIINDFRKQIIDYFEGRKNKDEDQDVCQLDIQFFRLTNSGGSR